MSFWGFTHGYYSQMLAHPLGGAGMSTAHVWIPGVAREFPLVDTVHPSMTPSYQTCH